MRASSHRSVRHALKYAAFPTLTIPLVMTGLTCAIMVLVPYGGWAFFFLPITLSLFTVPGGWCIALLMDQMRLAWAWLPLCALAMGVFFAMLRLERAFLPWCGHSGDPSCIDYPNAMVYWLSWAILYAVPIATLWLGGAVVVWWANEP